MVRFFGIGILISVLVLQSLSTSIVLFHFKINQAKIASELCENKEVPEMHCEGKCYLEKQIKADEEAHTDDQQFRVEFVSLVFTSPTWLALPSLPHLTKLHQEFPYITPRFTTVFKAIFQPPRY